MSFLRKWFGGKQSATPTRTQQSTTPTRTEQSYFFICSGNPSIIDAYNSLFKVGALAYMGAAGHYSIYVGSLSTRREEASAAAMPFAGESYMGAKSAPVSQMHEVLRAIEVSTNKDAHIAFVSVDQSGVSWVHKVYNELLNQAVTQGILPFKMVVTNDKDASEFLLGSFTKVS